MKTYFTRHCTGMLTEIDLLIFGGDVESEKFCAADGVRLGMSALFEAGWAGFNLVDCCTFELSSCVHCAV